MAVPGWVLKLCATAVTGLATAGAAGYVSGHLKNPAAPLQPPVVAQAQPAPVLQVKPEVQVSPGQPALTFTSVS